jgi:ribosomal protein S12 methylthiotransferase accessory factor
MRSMLLDAVSAVKIHQKSSIVERAIASFLGYIERKLGVTIVRNTRGVPETLTAPLQLAALLKARGIIERFGVIERLADEPRTKSWFAICNNPTKESVGGTAWESDADALYAALAEALERYVWLTQDDYFNDPRVATTGEIAHAGRFIAPERFSGFSQAQRVEDPKRAWRDVPYHWVRAESLTSADTVYVPSQVVTPKSPGRNEPYIRQVTTNGLATWPTKNGARLAGLLELIERDAYMITWLNQLTLPRIPVSQLREMDGALRRALDACERYRLRPHVVRLITDAPTHAVAVLLEDLSGLAPRFSIGLRAHPDLSQCVLKAMTEALRAHRGYRRRAESRAAWDNATPVGAIGHRERLDYWGHPDNANHLGFFISGPEVNREPEAWEKDSPDEHLARLIAWCREKGYECAAVSLSSSVMNPTPLYIEMLVVPELQPAYLEEERRTLGGERLKSIPAMFGYRALPEPFTARPHPFS